MGNNISNVKPTHNNGVYNKDGKKIETWPFGGDSKSRSNVTSNVTNLLVNQSDLNFLNSQLNDLSTDIVMNAAKTCSTTVYLQNLLDFSEATIAGDFVATGVNLSQLAEVSFGCVNTDTVTSEITVDMIDSMLASLNSSLDASAINDIENTSAAEASTGFLATGDTSSRSNLDQTLTNTIINEDTKNIQNVMENVIDNRMENNSIQECISNVQMIQGYDGERMTLGGSFYLEDYNSEQVSDTFGKCIQDSTFTNDITTAVTKELGMEIIDDVSMGTDNTVTNISESIAFSGGLFGMGSLSCCLLMILCVVGVLFFLKQSGVI